MLISIEEKIGPQRVELMKFSWHRSHGKTFGFLVLESYGIIVSELDEIQCNVVTDSIGGSKE